MRDGTDIIGPNGEEIVWAYPHEGGGLGNNPADGLLIVQAPIMLRVIEELADLHRYANKGTRLYDLTIMARAIVKRIARVSPE